MSSWLLRCESAVGRISSRGSSAAGAAQWTDFEWDPDKEETNIADRGLEFTTASRIWGGPVLEKIDDRHDYGETRILASGKVDGRLMVVVYTLARRKSSYHFGAKG